LNKLYSALTEAGIEVDKNLFDNYERSPGLFRDRYEGRPEFSEDFFRIDL